MHIQLANPCARHGLARVVATTVTAGILLVGCQGKSPPAPLQGTLTVKGSNTFGEELAAKLFAAYKQRQPNVQIVHESKGTASGMTALIEGTCDIAAASRWPSAEENSAAQSRGISLQGDVIGSYGVAVIVNSANPIRSLKPPQVRDIFTGAISNWRDVGGTDAPIQVCIRDAAAGTHAGFRELAMENKDYSPAATAYNSYGDVAEAVAKQPQAVGYASAGRSQRPGIRPLTIGKVDLTTLSVNEGAYPYSRVLRLYTDKQRQTAVARDFIDFVRSEDGQKVVAEMGFVRRLERRLESYTHD